LKFIQECALVQSEATLVALQLEPIKVLSVIGQRTKERTLNKFEFFNNCCGSLILTLKMYKHLTIIISAVYFNFHF